MFANVPLYMLYGGGSHTQKNSQHKHMEGNGAGEVAEQNSSHISNVFLEARNQLAPSPLCPLLSIR